MADVLRVAGYSRGTYSARIKLGGDPTGQKFDEIIIDNVVLRSPREVVLFAKLVLEIKANVLARFPESAYDVPFDAIGPRTK